MKNAGLFYLAIAMSFLPLRVAAVEFESKTVTVYPASLFEQTISQDVITFSDSGFDFSASIGTEVDPPTISIKQNFLRLYDGNSLTIRSTQGADITSVVLNVSDYYLGYQEISGTAEGWAQNPDDLSEWTGQGSEFTLTVYYAKKPDLDHNYNSVIVNYINIESITITYLEEAEELPDPEPDPEPAPEYGAVDFRFTDTRVSYSGTTGIVSFNLSVVNDDGVQKFTVVARDHETKIEYGRADFEPVEVEEPQGSAMKLAANEGKSYNINGTLPLSGINNDARPVLRLGAYATYPDGSEAHLEESDEPSVSAQDQSGTTSITDITETSMNSSEYYDLHGRRIHSPASGIIIEKDGAKVVKKHL